MKEPEVMSAEKNPPDLASTAAPSSSEARLSTFSFVAAAAKQMRPRKSKNLAHIMPGMLKLPLDLIAKSKIFDCGGELPAWHGGRTCAQVQAPQARVCE